MSIELKAAKDGLRMAALGFKNLRAIYAKHPLDARRTVDSGDEGDIVCFCDHALLDLTGAIESLDQIQERLDEIATRRNVT